MLQALPLTRSQMARRNAVKTAQRIMIKALEAGSDPYLGFLDFHNTPIEGLGTSPAQRLFGRRTKTLLPTAGRLRTQPEFDTTSQLLHAHKNPKFGKVSQVPTGEFPTKFPDWDLSHSSKFGIFVGIL